MRLEPFVKMILLHLLQGDDIGIDAFDFSGHSLSSAGDINNDGYDDIIIGAYKAAPNGDSSGESYVVFGKASGNAIYR